MSKRAEEKALRMYPVHPKTIFPQEGKHGEILNFDEWLDDFRISVQSFSLNAGFRQGYELAEKDLGWISVKDRLPEKNGWYFTCVEQFKIPQCVGITYFDKKDGWWLNDMPLTERIFVSTIEIVDYWMEIPALPKEEEK